MRVILFFLVGMIGLGAVAGCDTYGERDPGPELVVEAYLIAGEALPPVKVSRTAPLDAAYAFEDYAVEGATVRIDLLDEAGAVEQSFRYVPRGPGIYLPASPTDAVLPRRRYALEVETPLQREAIRAATVVPGTFELLEANADTVVYQSSGQLETLVTPSFYPGRQSIYIFTLQALDTVNYGLTPIYAGFDELDPSEVVENQSGLVNEQNFDVNPDGTLTLRLPWIAVAFYGPNRVVANAVDDNLYDFIRSQTVQLGGSLLSPGEIHNVIDHVENGTGIFGAIARARITIFVAGS